MEKGFILVEVPGSCLDCRFCVELQEGIEAYCALEHNSYSHDEFKKIDVSYPQDKPSWCPIKELPKRRVGYLFSSDHKDNYKHGWNACIDYMEGK